MIVLRTQISENHLRKKFGIKTKRHVGCSTIQLSASSSFEIDDMKTQGMYRFIFSNIHIKENFSTGFSEKRGSSGGVGFVWWEHTCPLYPWPRINDHSVSDAMRQR